jgi:hypothetical protein
MHGSAAVSSVDLGICERALWRPREAILCETAFVSTYTDALRSRLRAIPVAPPPAPWTAVPPIAVGGLTHLGVSAADGVELVLAISQGGRGLFNDQGTLVARDADEPVESWLDEFGLEAVGIGPLADRRVRVAGLAGGGLPTSTRDGWHVSSLPIDWPHDLVILEPPGCRALWQGHERGCVAVFANDACELRAYGFSPSGRMLVLASSADLRLYVRDSAGNSV